MFFPQNNNLIGLHFMACIFVYLSPRSILLFLQRFKFHFEIFFPFDLKVFHLSLGLNLNIQTNSEKFQI
jgi:hypothetical protein